MQTSQHCDTMVDQGNDWPKFSVILLTLKMYHFQLPLRSLVWELSLTASWPRHVSSSALLLSHEAASYSQKVTDHKISQDYCSGAHCKLNRLLQQSFSSDQCWRSTSSAVSTECRCSTHHAEVEIWTHYTATLRDDLHWLPIRQQ